MIIRNRAETKVRIENEMGLHTRPAKSFVQLACRFESSIEVDKGGTVVNGKSIMGLMSLLVPRGTVIHIVAVGPDADEAVTALANLVQRRFEGRAP
jgi:phosphotransferase system HPr (HPr) family protein